jgi:hypothetical protein
MKCRNGRIEEPKNRGMKCRMINDEWRMKWRNGRIEEPENAEWNAEW